MFVANTLGFVLRISLGMSMKFLGDLPKTHSGHLQDISWTSPGNSWTFPGHFLDMSWKFLELSWKVQRIFQEISTNFPGHFHEISRKCPGNFWEMSLTCPGKFQWGSLPRTGSVTGQVPTFSRERERESRVGPASYSQML